jgi:beta-1,4-mannooligosaccharide/beta-1,4-mannosyl-N-acetylglucosamine phosphorylase
MAALTPILRSSPVIKRFKDGEPVLSAQHIPYKAECVFNAGVAKFQGKYVMVFRDDRDYDTQKQMFRERIMGVAESNDGVNWEVREKPFLTKDMIPLPDIVYMYDPRVTVLEGAPYLCFAVDTNHGVCGGIARIDDNFEKITILSLSAPDNRNMVLFPEKIGGLYWRLERPFPVYSRGGVDRFDMWASASPDMRYWGDTGLVLAVEDVPWANDKIGPGAPPVKTKKGWLTLFHAVDRDRSRGKNGWEDCWQKRYCIGIALLDPENPAKVVGLCKTPLMAPETDYEVNEGFRANVLFPGGLIVEDSGEVKIYYGVSDTVECLATANLDDLIDLCETYSR